MQPIVTDRVVWTVILSVCHSSEPCKNAWTDRDIVWVEVSGGLKELCIRWRSRSPMGSGKFGGRGAHWDGLPWALQKRLNRSRCSLGCGLG